MQETEEGHDEEEPREYIKNSIYSAVYQGLPREGKLKIVGCIHQHEGDIQRAFENDFPSHCRDSCQLGAEGIAFCSAVVCLLEYNDTYELVKTVGRTDTENMGLLESIDITNKKGNIERRLMSVEDWKTMAELYHMHLPEENPLLDYSH